MQFLKRGGINMNNQYLNASCFVYSSTFYNENFEKILVGIIACYYCIVESKIKLPPNDENKVRDIMLFDYLKKLDFKNSHFPLANYHFDKETYESKGRADIRILHVNPYKDDYAYYIIECKRLDNGNRNGKIGLNGEYIANGIARFILEKKYPFYNDTAGMLGFVVEKMDIHQNISAINQLLKNTFTEINTEKELTPRQIVSSFEYSYCSSHKIEDSSKIIYHLMFDFSKNITQQ